MISSFTNLRTLELVSFPLGRGHTATVPNVYLPHLENLKLRGYVPAALDRKFCSNGEHITHLDLELLANPKDDAAYAGILLKNDDSWALVSDEAAEYYQQNGAEAAAPVLKSMGTTDEKEGDGDDDDDNEKEPRALHDPTWLPRSLPRRFSKLTHFHPVKPYDR